MVIEKQGFFHSFRCALLLCADVYLLMLSTIYACICAQISCVPIATVPQQIILEFEINLRKFC